MDVIQETDMQEVHLSYGDDRFVGGDLRVGADSLWSDITLERCGPVQKPVEVHSFAHADGTLSFEARYVAPTGFSTRITGLRLHLTATGFFFCREAGDEREDGSGCPGCRIDEVPLPDDVAVTR